MILDLIARLLLWLECRMSPPAPSDGCCGCGAAMCDVQTIPGPGYPRGEGYCWSCVDSKGWFERYTVYPGRERGAVI